MYRFFFSYCESHVLVKDKTENLKNTRLAVRAHVKQLFVPLSHPSLSWPQTPLYLEALDKQQIVSKYFYEDYSLLGVSRCEYVKSWCVYNLLLWWKKAYFDLFKSSELSFDVFFANLWTLQTAEWPSRPSYLLINLVTPCIYNKVISLHILFNHFLLINTGFFSLWRLRQSVPLPTAWS
jgi:hypothetical protein